MKNSNNIKTTGELRAYLCESIEAVGDGLMSSEKARDIVKLSSQVNESLYSEVKVSQTQIELGAKAASFGHLDLGVPETK